MHDDSFIDHTNPYAAPASSTDRYELNDAGDGILRIEGKDVVCRSEVRFPAMCVRTGKTDDLVEVRKPLYWAPGWIWLLILMNVIILAIVYMIVRKRVDVTYYIDRSERSSRRWKTFLGFLLFLSGLVGTIGVIAMDQAAYAIIAVVVMVAGLATTISASTPLRPVKHNDGIFHIRGCSDVVLDRFRESYDGGF